MNWPGANVERLAGDGLELERPRVAQSRGAGARPGTAAAPSARGRGDSAAAVVAIHVQEPEPRPLQALDQHLREPRHQVVAEARGSVSHLPRRQAPSKLVARTSASALRVEVPAVGREEPRPADDLAGVDRLDRHRRRAPGRTSRARRCRAGARRRCPPRRPRGTAARRPRSCTLRAAAGDQLELRPAVRPWKSGTSCSRAVNRLASATSSLVADRGQLLGDVDPDRAPGDAAAAADAAGAAELVVPGAELVGEPLAVARAAGRPDAAAVDVGVVDREARVPAARPLRLVAREVGDVLDARAEAGRADQRAVAAGQAARRRRRPSARARGCARAGRGGRWCRAVGPSARRRRSTARPAASRSASVAARARQLGQDLGAALGPGLDEEAVRLRRGSRSAPGRSRLSAFGPVPIETQKQVPAGSKQLTATMNASLRRAA